MLFIKESNFTYVKNYNEEEFFKLKDILSLSYIEYPSGITLYKEFLYTHEDHCKFFTGLVPYVLSKLGTLPLSIKDNIIVKNFNFEIPENLLSGITLRYDQISSIRKCMLRTRGIVDLPTRTGKTEIFCGVSKLYQDNVSSEKKILILEEEVGLMEQTAKRLLSRGIQNVGLLGDSQKDYDKQIIVCTIDTLYNSFKKGANKEFFSTVGGIIVDECFPGDTLVDGKPISTLKTGDFVKSFNHNSKKIELKKILRIFKSELKTNLIKIRFSNGSEFMCTPEHPIYDSNSRSYISAKNLNVFHSAVCIREHRILHKEPYVNKCYPESVEEILDFSCDYVYNIEVEGNNNYFAEGILVHNCHHLSATSYKSIVSDFNDLDLLLGFSGTPLENRDDPYKSPKDAAIIGCLHSTIVKISPQYFIDLGVISEPNVFFIPYDFNKQKFFIKNYSKVYDRFIVNNFNRNTVATHIIRYCYPKNLSVLVSVTRISHGKEILKMLNMIEDVVFSYGGNTNISLYSKELYLRYQNQIKEIKIDEETNQNYIYYNDNFDLMKEVNEKRIRVLIGSSIFDEGRDIPSLDGIILLAGGSSHVKSVQRPARALTKNSTRNKSFIIDFEDLVHPYLKSHSNTRKKLYEENCYNIYYGIADFIKFLNSL